MRQAVLMVLNCAIYGSAVEKTVGLLEKEMKLAYPNFVFVRCYSNPYVINQLREKGIAVRSVDEALKQLSSSEMESVIVLPMHIYQDYDYSLVKKQMKKYKNHFERIAITKPLLSKKIDYDAFVCAVGQHQCNECDLSLYITERETKVTTICRKLNKCFHKNGFVDCFVKSVPDTMHLKDIIKQAQKSNKNTIRVFQLKFVPEIHSELEFNTCYYATERLENKQLEAECVLQGLGEFPEIRALYLMKIASYL